MDENEQRALIDSVFEGYQKVVCPICCGEGTLKRGLGVTCPRCGGKGVSDERVAQAPNGYSANV